mgnify:CR=1 FL=1
MSIVDVRTERPYRVRIEHGALAHLPSLVPDAARVGLVHSEQLADAAEKMANHMPGRIIPVPVPDGEAAKNPQVLASCWSRLADAGLTRCDVVIGLGGGATTDLAGFVAASWLRGVGCILLPTTVLAMVDATVGGKTGINLPQGKNLVGAFHEPLGVLADLDFLATLSQRDISSGLAETIKAGFIRDRRILESIQEDPADACDAASDRLAELITRGVVFKAEVVGEDLREATSVEADIGRELLNYGHTLGHAIEIHEHFRLRHGEAVSVGMVFAALLSHRLIGLPEEAVETHISCLRMLGLPVSYADAQWEDLRELMAHDKKSRGTTLRFVGLRELGVPEMITSPDEQVLAECYAQLGRI